MADTPLSTPSLCTIIHGVEARMVVGDRVVRVIVPAEALQHYFDATFDAETWLAVFESNAVVIAQRAKQAHAATQKNIVVLHEF